MESFSILDILLNVSEIDDELLLSFMDLKENVCILFCKDFS